MQPDIQQALAEGYQRLSTSPSADMDAKVLLCHVLNCATAYLFSWPDKALSPEQWQQYQQLLSQRGKGVPVAYLTGSRGFWTLDLMVNNTTLIPRADTELLVSLALSLLKPGMRVIDLGTGSGAIILALAVERSDLQLFASDVVFGALKQAQFNACRHQLGHVSFVQAKWLQAFKARQFDLIVSNPPYIRENDPHLKNRADVRFEPSTALISGQDGLEDIRQIVEQARSSLKPGGWLLVEHGYDQGKQVVALFEQAGFDRIECHQDLGAQDRAVWGQLVDREPGYKPVS